MWQKAKEASRKGAKAQSFYSINPRHPEAP